MSLLQNLQIEKLFIQQHLAKKFMAIAERFSKVQSTALFSQTQMMEMLALPDGEEENFIEDKAAQGKSVEEIIC